ncbi:MAG: hypothetical protein K8T89_08065, partial [Planctomycetes bacterium]|nr:hypothetical protein [Planctomycetota bacterium]
MLSNDEYRGIDGTKRLVDATLGILALAPEMPGKAGQVKRELILTRVAHRLGLRMETVWARFGELKDLKKKEAARSAPAAQPEAAAPQAPAAGPAPPLERQLLELLLADPALVPLAEREVQPNDMTHSGLRKLLEGLYGLKEKGDEPELEGLRTLIGNAALIDWAMDHRDIGRAIPDRRRFFKQVLGEFQKRREAHGKGQLKNELTAVSDHGAAMD